VLAAIREQVAAGEPLAAALSRFPRSFSDLYRGLVAVGAESGQLGGVLSRLADYLEARQVLRAQFTAALIYPALITVIALAVIATLLLYVVPQIVAVYQQSRQALPFLTRALIATSDFLRATGVYWLAAIALVIAGAVLLLRNESWRDRWHGLLLRTPVAGSSDAALIAMLTAAGIDVTGLSTAPELAEHPGPRQRSSGRVRCGGRRTPPRAWCEKACRWHARWRASACFRRCSCIWWPTASRAASCRRCSTAPRASRSSMSNAA
jgi:general secretion pathway protein F